MTSGQSYESLADLLQSGPLSSSTSPRKATGPSRRERYGAISSDPAPRFVRGSTATDVVHSDLTPISHMPTVPVSEIVLPKKVSTIKVIATLMSLFAATTLWSIEFAFGTPALLSLGLSRSSASLVWLAGPFTGTICQPLIGSLSDADHSNWRRRKYIVASFVLCIIFAFLVAFAQPVAHLILRYFSRIEDWDPKRHELSLKVAAFIAVPSFWGLDFALNALQAASRALLIDTVPGHQQPAANAWQGKICQLGNVLGYGIGFTDLGNDKLLKHLPGGQFGRLIILASVISAFCVAITCFCIQEKPSEPSKSSTKKGQDAEEASALRVLKDIKAELRGLPTPLRRVCLVQFFSWIGWFPFLFFASTYISERFAASRDFPPTSDIAVRSGSLALLYHSVVGLIASALFPLLYWLGKHPALLPTFTRPIFSRMTLRNLWCFSQLFFTLDTAAMFMTRSFKGGTVEVTCLGLCWAVTAWIPFALVGEMIHELSDTQPTSPPEQPACENTTPGSPTWSETQSLLKATRPMSGGTILGIHNLAIVIPQFISSLAASVIFKIASAASSDTNQQNSLAGGEGIAYVFLLGSFSSLSAAYLTRRIPPTQSELAFQQSYRT